MVDINEKEINLKTFLTETSRSTKCLSKASKKVWNSRDTSCGPVAPAEGSREAGAALQGWGETEGGEEDTANLLLQPSCPQHFACHWGRFKALTERPLGCSWWCPTQTISSAQSCSGTCWRWLKNNHTNQRAPLWIHIIEEGSGKFRPGFSRQPGTIGGWFCPHTKWAARLGQCRRTTATTHPRTVPRRPLLAFLCPNLQQRPCLYRLHCCRLLWVSFYFFIFSF